MSYLDTFPHRVNRQKPARPGIVKPRVHIIRQVDRTIADTRGIPLMPRKLQRSGIRCAACPEGLELLRAEECSGWAGNRAGGAEVVERIVLDTIRQICG